MIVFSQSKVSWTAQYHLGEILLPSLEWVDFEKKIMQELYIDLGGKGDNIFGLSFCLSVKILT
jgi:hypothetical protein